MYTWPKATEKSRSCVGSHVGGVGNRGVWAGEAERQGITSKCPLPEEHNHTRVGPGAELRGSRSSARGGGKGKEADSSGRRDCVSWAQWRGKLSYTKLGSEKQGKKIGLMQGREKGGLEQREWALPLPALARTSNLFSWITTKRTDITTHKKYIKKL